MYTFRYETEKIILFDTFQDRPDQLRDLNNGAIIKVRTEESTMSMREEKYRPWKSRTIRYSFRVMSFRVMDVAVYFDIEITLNFHERKREKITP